MLWEKVSGMYSVVDTEQYVNTFELLILRNKVVWPKKNVDLQVQHIVFEDYS